MSIRVITGIAKGRKLAVPTGAKPLTDRIKTSIFDSIRELIPGSKVLDLYAGSGAFGIEALSRGAKSATFVELSSKGAQIIKENLFKVGFDTRGTVVKQNAMTFLQESENEEEYDIVFFDPPFEKAYKVDFGLAKNVLKPGGIAIFRYPKSLKKEVESRGLEQIQKKKYGRSIVGYYRKLDN